jgi:hypothetical protein
MKIRKKEKNKLKNYIIFNYYIRIKVKKIIKN